MAGMKKLICYFFGDGGAEKFFRPNLILDKYLKLWFPKVFFNLKPQ